MKQVVRIVLGIFYLTTLSVSIQSSEFVAEALETAGIEDAEGTLNRGLTEGLIEGGSAETLDALSPEMQDSLKEELTNVLKDNAQALESGKINVESITQQTTDNFYKNVEEFGAQGKIDIQSQAALNKFNFQPDELQNINSIQERPSSALNTDEITVEPTPSAETSVAIDADKLISVQADEPSVIKNAQTTFDQSVEALTTQNASLVSDAEESLNKASENVDTLSQQDDAQNTIEAQDAQQQSEQTLQDAKEVKKEGERLSSRQKLKIAQEKLNVTEQQLSTNDQTLKQAQADLKELENAPDALKEAKTALESATDEEKPALEQKVQDLEGTISNKEQLSKELNEKITTLSQERDLLLEDRASLKADASTQGSIKSLEKAYLDSTDQWELKLRAKSAFGQLKDGVGSTAFGALSSGGGLLAQSVVFMLPSIALSMWQSFMGNKDIIDTLKEVQTFGNILMKLPDDFINKDQPQASKFVYVGLPNHDTSLTDEFLKTANYYVTKPSFGEPGSVAITDPNFPGQMIHLNTGYVFMGDGAAADSNNPTISFLERGANRANNLVTIIEKLSSGMYAGGVTSDVSGNFTGLLVDSKAHYRGNQTIASLFSPKKSVLNTQDAIPPLLFNTFKCLQNGTNFGPFRLQGYTDLAPTFIKKISDSTSTTPPQAVYDDIPYVARGVYIYQTQDTPLIKSVLSSSNDPVFKANLRDYLVVLDSEDNYAIVPLEVPLPSPLKGHFAEYHLSLQAKKTYYLMSLLDFSVYGIDFSMSDGKIIGFYGTPNTINPSTYIQKNFAQYPSVVTQIQQVSSYINNQKKYGPFKQGIHSLTIDPTLADQEIFVYKWEKSLENQQDDYLIAVQLQSIEGVAQPCLRSVNLPSDRVVFFVSLVTSRFYDTSLNAYQPPLYPYSNYYIVAPQDNPAALSVINYGTKRQPDASMIVYARPSDPLHNKKTRVDNDATAPLFTLFVDGDINPNPVPTLSNQALPENVSLSHLPVPLLWALTSNIILYDTQNKLLGQVLKKEVPALYAALIDHHTAWKTWVLQHNKGLLDQQMGPYAFMQSALHTIYLSATSAADIGHGNYVYTSPDYPDEYLVMIQDLSLSGLAEQFNNQQYILSLSTGTIYDANNQGAAITTVIDMTTINSIVQKLALRPTLNKAIEDSQQLMMQALQSHLIGPDIDFGPFDFYLNHTDFYNKQYIYAHVNDLDVLKHDGTENKSEIAKIKDYFVCFDHATKKFGMPMSGSIDYVVSLVSGILFNRAGTYVGSLDEFESNSTSVAPMASTQSIVESIEKSSSKPIAPGIISAIKRLTKASIAQHQKEQSRLIALKKQDDLFSDPLSSNIAANCSSAPYIEENHSIIPQRFLKKVGQRYYRMLTAKQVSIIVDYAAHQDCALIYKRNTPDTPFYPISAVRGAALTIMRQAAGIIVDAQGKESLSLPMHGIHLDTSSMINLDAQKQLYYNPLTDLYYVQGVHQGTTVYINLLDGQMHLSDGSACLEQQPIYMNKRNAILYEGNDSAGLVKFIVNNKGSYSSYSTIQSYPSCAQLQAWRTKGQDIDWTSVKTNQKNVLNYGILYVAVNDLDPSDSLRIIKLVFDENNQVLAQPYFVVETTPDRTIEKYTQSSSQSLTLLSYAQTRNVGLKEGSFIAADESNPITGVQHVLALIINKSTQKPEMIMYDTNVVPLSSERSVKLPLSNCVASFKQNEQANKWISINNGKKAFDYLYNYASLPLYGECKQQNNALSCVQQSVGLYVTPFINHSSTPCYQALVNPLSVLLSVPTIQSSKEQNADMLIFQERSKAILLDEHGIIYQSKKSSAAQRFVICLTKSILKECGIQDTSLIGCYVDLYNGILYFGSIAYGRSLTRYQLQRLVDWLGVRLIAQTDSQQPESITYR